MRRVLIVAPHFAPVSAPDGQRARMLAPHLTACGWEPVVLTVDPTQVEAAQDASLMETLPAALPVVATGAWPRRFTRLLGLGNIGWRAYRNLARTGDRLLREEDFDLVYFSTTQFACVPLGVRWKRRFGVPFVVDLQDPWRSDYYERPGAPHPPGGWKYQLARVLARREGPTLRRAAHVIAVSPDYLHALAGRYPWFSAERASVIPFGWSALDQQVAARQAGNTTHHPHIFYAGRLGDDMRTALQAVFELYADFRRAHPDATPVAWEFIGTSYDPSATGEGHAVRCARSVGLDDLVTEDRRRSPYLTMLARQQRCSANLVLGSDDAAYSPSKLWPILATGRPLLATAPRGSVLMALLEARAPADSLILETDAPAPPPETVARFFHALHRLPASPPGGPGDPALAAYEARIMARRHAAIFDSCLA